MKQQLLNGLGLEHSKLRTAVRKFGARADIVGEMEQGKEWDGERRRGGDSGRVVVGVVVVDDDDDEEEEEEEHDGALCTR